MGNEIAVKVVSTANMAGVRKEAAVTGKAVGTDIKQGFDKAEKAASSSVKGIGSDLGNLEAKAKQAGDAVGDGLAGGVEKSGGKISGALDSAMGMLPGIAGTAAAGVGAVFMSGFADAMAAEKVEASFVGSLGATSGQAAKLGAAAGAAYADNFGESLEEVAKALEGLVKAGVVDMDAPVAELQKLAGEAITTAGIVEEEVGRVARSVSTMLRTGMADNASEAFDMIARASQAGLNVSEDLLDTIDEYSTQFRKLGLDGPAAFGLLRQAVQAGARDTDTAADAIKEFTLLSIDGSAKTRAAFEALGLDAEKMSEKLAAGGPEAAKAFGLVMDKLRGMEDPLARNAAAVGLFGTKAEDMGASLEAMDMDSAITAFGDFKGAVDKANEAVEKTDADQLEDLWRSATTGATTAAAAMLDFVDIGSSVNEMHAEGVAKIKAELEARRDATGAVDEQGKALDKTTGSMASQAGMLDDLIRKNNEFYNGKLGVRGAEVALQEAIDSATESVKEHGKTLDINTEAGRANRTALDDIASSTLSLTGKMLDNQASGEQITKVMADARASFIATARAMGYGATEAENMANELGLIVGDYSAKVYVEAESAKRELGQVKWMADQATRPRTIYINYSSSGVNLTAPSRVGGMAHGGVAGSHAAEGGPRGGRVLVGEHGPEEVLLAPGSMVKSNPDTMAALERDSRGGGTGLLEVRFTGNTDAAFAAAFQELVRKNKIQLRVVNGNRVAVG